MADSPQHGRPPPGETRRLARFTSTIDAYTLPAEVVTRAKQVIADSLACGVGGLSLAPDIVGPLQTYARSTAGTPEATVLGGGRAMGAIAALANATLIHTIDYDDTHMPAIAHFGAPVTATALAVLEHRGGAGRDLITAVVAGFEAGGRVGRAVLPGHYHRWHSTSSLGGIAAAAAAARAWGLDAERTDIAIGFAADDAAGTRYCIKVGDFSKSLHAGVAAWKGYQAAMLAACGARGPTGILEHPFGFFWSYSEEREPSRLAPALESLGVDWEILEDDIKAVPSIHASHTAIEATADIVAEHRVVPAEIAAIRVTQPFFSDHHALNYEPDSPMAARLSLPFCVAVAAIDGKVGLRSFEARRYLDPGIRTLMAKVSSTADPTLNERFPNVAASFVEIETTAGRVYRAHHVYPRGSHKRPLSTAEHRQKLEELLSLTLENRDVASMVEALDRLHELDTVGEITRHFPAARSEPLVEA